MVSYRCYLMRSRRRYDGSSGRFDWLLEPNLILHDPPLHRLLSRTFRYRRPGLES